MKTVYCLQCSLSLTSHYVSQFALGKSEENPKQQITSMHHLLPAVLCWRTKLQAIQWLSSCAIYLWD